MRSGRRRLDSSELCIGFQCRKMAGAVKIIREGMWGIRRKHIAFSIASFLSVLCLDIHPDIHHP
jgi:hypothetical protein